MTTPNPSPAKASLLSRARRTVANTLERARRATGFSTEGDLTWPERKLAVAGVELALLVFNYEPRQAEGACESDDACLHYLFLTRLSEALAMPGAMCGPKARAYDSFAYYASQIATERGRQYILDDADAPPWDAGSWSTAKHYPGLAGCLDHSVNKSLDAHCEKLAIRDAQAA